MAPPKPPPFPPADLVVEFEVLPEPMGGGFALVGSARHGKLVGRGGLSPYTNDLPAAVKAAMAARAAQLAIADLLRKVRQ
jgi:hypothetical protein